MPAVSEVGPHETDIAYAVIVELRPDIGSREEFVTRVNERQRPEGYRLIVSAESPTSEPAAVAGFRTGHSLAWGHHLYVDDLVTAAAARRRGHAAALMRWLYDEATKLGCEQLHLDSGTHRHDAHRFYLSNGLVISSFHFSRALG
jgi:GNAT superfamily N-acetyltransferase